MSYQVYLSISSPSNDNMHLFPLYHCDTYTFSNLFVSLETQSSRSTFEIKIGTLRHRDLLEEQDSMKSYESGERCSRVKVTSHTMDEVSGFVIL